MPTNHPEPSPGAEKPVAGQQQRKARYVYRRADSGYWEAGCLIGGIWIAHSAWSTAAEAAIAATRLNGNEPDVDGGGLFE